MRTLACAVCASDHHYVDHPDVNAADKSGMRVDAPDCDVIMGHEFCAEIVDYGPDCQKTLPIGTRVTSIPVLMGADEPARIVGYSPEAPAGTASTSCSPSSWPARSRTLSPSSTSRSTTPWPWGGSTAAPA